jgi:chemotaxis protein MotB
MSAKPDEKPEGAPEWMVSFADMITIMMSFFVIMFAIASGEAAKGRRHPSPQQQAAIESLQHRFGPKYQPFSSWGLMPGNSPVPHAGSRQKSPPPGNPPSPEGATVKAVRNERARIRVPGHGDRVVIGGVVAFADAGTVLADDQKAHLQMIAEELAGKPHQVEVLGHASNRPLPRGSSGRDRWDLAYTRCREVAQLLRTMKIDPERVRIAVAQAGDAPGGPAAAAPSGDTQVEVYLTDVLPETAGGTREAQDRREAGRQEVGDRR